MTCTCEYEVPIWGSEHKDGCPEDGYYWEPDPWPPADEPATEIEALRMLCATAAGDLAWAIGYIERTDGPRYVDQLKHTRDRLLGVASANS